MAQMFNKVAFSAFAHIHTHTSTLERRETENKRGRQREREIEAVQPEGKSRCVCVVGFCFTRQMCVRESALILFLVGTTRTLCALPFQIN